MSKVLTVRIAPELLMKAQARAVQLGMDRTGYVRNLIEQDLHIAKTSDKPRLVSEDLVGAFRLGGRSATNQRAREVLKQKSATKRERHR
ncbi:MAG: hypothetical protein JWM99_2323 [Verrucomicrobiales bacterium]|jgi:hypothetical protein|nr:hypothetical protein [Verrucomicrobiales bacterium]